MLEYDPVAATRIAGSMVDLLGHKFSSDPATFTAFEKATKAHVRRGGKALEEEVAGGLVIRNMQDASLKEHLVLHSKRLKHVYGNQRRDRRHQPHSLDNFGADGCRCARGRQVG